MSNKQKIILCMSAILIIIFVMLGVTYAYFLARINYVSTTEAIITTASLGAYYQDDNQVIIFENALPGTTVYKSFTVNNESDVPVPFSVTVATSIHTTNCSDGMSTTKTSCEIRGGIWDENSSYRLPEFVHSTLTDTLISTCYVSSSFNNKPIECYNGEYYNNIKVQLFRVDNSNLKIDEFLDIDWNNTNSAKYKNFETYTGGTKVNITTNSNNELISLEAPYNNNTDSSGNEIYLDSLGGTKRETVAGVKDGASVSSNYYILKVMYLDTKKNQNIENGAVVSLKVNIQA